MKRRWLLYPALAVVVGLVGLRAALPGLVKDYVNDVLAGLEGYRGQVSEVDIALWRGEYSLHGLEISRHPETDSPAFAAVPRIDVSLEWGALMRGVLVVDIHLREPRVVFIDAEEDAEDQLGLLGDWSEKLDSLTPFRLNVVSVDGGRMELLDHGGSDTPIAYADRISVQARNLSNIGGRDDEAFATLEAGARAYGQAPVRVNGRLDPMQDPPDLELDAELENLPLTALNPLLTTYANVDAETGSFALYLEFASADGRFEGYAKPFIQDVKLTRGSGDDGPLREAWEGIVELAVEALENEPREQAGARIPLSGELEAVDAELVPAVFSILRNAFVEALTAGITESVGLENLEIGSGDSESSNDD